MRGRLITTLMFGIFSGSIALLPSTVSANNRSVESALVNYGDASIFYQALANTGVLAELDENTRYTVFAPTNAAFAEIRPDVYPCFYSEYCRPALADVLRDHIVVGNKSLKELVREAEVPTLGRYQIYAESPYVGAYTVAKRTILSDAEAGGSRIYRINGVIITNPQLAQFRALPQVSELEPERSVTVYRTSAARPVPGGYPTVVETAARRTYVIPASGVTVYPGHTRVTTTRRTYVSPEGLPVGGEVTTIRTSE